MDSVEFVGYKGPRGQLDMILLSRFLHCPLHFALWGVVSQW